MTSQVLHNNVEVTFIAVESATFYGVKVKPSRVLVNSQDATFTYRDNQVRFGVIGKYAVIDLGECENPSTFL